MPQRAVIVDAVRTASGRGKPGGALSGTHPADVLGQTLNHLINRTGIDPATVDDMVGACVSQARDQALNISRTAWLAAGLPETVPATTIDRQCGSSQQALHFAAQGVMAGVYDVAVAGGVESMSRVPLGVAGSGGDPLAPLDARYPGGLVSQGVASELVSTQWAVSRSELDDFAARSHQRAEAASADGLFDSEIVPVVTSESADHHRDETIRSTTAESLAGLPAAFATPEMAERFPDVAWSTTAGNSSPLTDGAAAVLVMSEQRAHDLGLRPRAALTAFAAVGSDPLMMLTGVIPATTGVLQRAGLAIDDIDVFEVNEAFASVPLAWQHEFGVDPATLNPRGGAIALGHPMGASGARILTTMLNHLEDIGGRYGLMTMCEFGGMANATIIERL